LQVYPNQEEAIKLPAHVLKKEPSFIASCSDEPDAIQVDSDWRNYLSAVMALS